MPPSSFVLFFFLLPSYKYPYWYGNMERKKKEKRIRGGLLKGGDGTTVTVVAGLWRGTLFVGQKMLLCLSQIENKV